MTSFLTQPFLHQADRQEMKQEVAQLAEAHYLTWHFLCTSQCPVKTTPMLREILVTQTLQVYPVKKKKKNKHSITDENEK